MNFADTKTLTNWFRLRRLMLDLGKKFTFRVFFYASTFLAFYSMIAIFMVLNYFKLIDFNLASYFWIIATFDTVIMGLILILVIRKGAFVNKYFSKHKE